jgi:hypothetical protein
MRLLLALAALLALAMPSRAQPVDLALVLAIDVSGSVSFEEYQLQTRGIAAAFESEEVWRAVSGSACAIAVSVLQWSGPTEQKAVIPWQRIETRADMLAFAKDVKWMRRAFDGTTDLGSALEVSGDLLDACPWPATRRIIDISGDGRSNGGPEPADVRDRLVARGIQINGLAIDAEEMGVADYYRDRVIGGPGAFVDTAKGFKDFARAILGKLIVEIALSPSPSTATY